MIEYINPAPMETKTISLDITPEVVLSKDLLRATLADIESISDHKLYVILKDYYTLVLDDIFEKMHNREYSEFIDLFTVPKFIIALTQAIDGAEILDTSRSRLNRMCYDYLVLKDYDKSEYVGTLLIALSKVANRTVISKLYTLALPEDLAALLALSRFSSEDEVTNVKRLNRVLMAQPQETLSEQKIVDIYLALFPHVLPLFTGVMLDVVPLHVNDDMAEVYGLITLAILDIMNELPIEDIKKGLYMFDSNRRIQYPDSQLRINLESCSQHDYPRFLKAIDSLREDGIYIMTR